MRLPLIVLIVCTSASASANSQSVDDWRSARFAVGAALGSTFGDRPLSKSLELTLTPRAAFGPFLSAGLAADSVARRSNYVYGEIAFWVYMTLGAGIGYRFGDEQYDREAGSGAAWHLFIGLPVPILGFPGRKSIFVWSGYSHGGMSPGVLYVEPYYRPQFGMSRNTGGTTHEIGLMVKTTFSISPRLWRTENRRL